MEVNIGDIALNERRELGLIKKIRTISGQKVYLGISLNSQDIGRFWATNHPVILSNVYQLLANGKA